MNGLEVIGAVTATLPDDITPGVCSFVPNVQAEGSSPFGLAAGASERGEGAAPKALSPRAIVDNRPLLSLTHRNAHLRDGGAILPSEATSAS
jgi:hypothetical protein